MKPIVSLLSVAAFAAVSGFAIAALASQRANSPQSSAPISSERIERGNYLVNRVGMCIDCHSPRDATGRFIDGKHLTGSPLGFAPTTPMPWAVAAPRIAGLPSGFTRAQTAHFLMTGTRPNGRPSPLPPMPPYRLDREDAEAIAAYLESLPGAPSE
jgi:mono/diheme cytochrome c family protein